jgi:hypothetical protein
MLGIQEAPRAAPSKFRTAVMFAAWVVGGFTKGIKDKMRIRTVTFFTMFSPGSDAVT